MESTQCLAEGEGRCWSYCWRTLCTRFSQVPTGVEGQFFRPGDSAARDGVRHNPDPMLLVATGPGLQMKVVHLPMSRFVGGPADQDTPARAVDGVDAINLKADR